MTNDAWKPYTPPGPFPKFPGWRYGPNGEAAIFTKEEDVPAGWADALAKAQAVQAVAADRQFDQPHHGHENAEALGARATAATAPAPRKPLTLKRREQPTE